MLVADATESISNGFKEAIGELINRIMCWPHMGRKCNDRLARISDKEIRANMRTDIYSLQLARNSQIFDKASKLFLLKWKNSNAQVDEFLTYFQGQWLGGLNGWYEGVSLFVPSTNNALESTNRVVKDESTMRERLPLGQFLDTVDNKIVGRWSRERQPGLVNGKKWHKEPIITTLDFTKGYQWISEKKF